MTASSKNRLLWLDIARGICILCMITTHALNWSNNAPVFAGFTGSWFLVFFFFCSGLCYSDKHDFKTYMIRQVKKLLLPYLLVVGGILFYRVYCGTWWHLTTAQKLRSFIASLLVGLPADFPYVPFFRCETIGIGPIWFFFCMFFASILYKLIYRSKYRLLLAIVIAAIGSYSQNFFLLPFNLQNACIGCMFIALGNSLKKTVTAFINHLQKKHAIYALLLAIAAFMLHTCILIFWPYNGFDLGTNSYSLFTLPTTLSGFLFLIPFASFMERTKIFDSFLAFCGSETFLIVILHSLDILVFRDWGNQGRFFLIGTILLYPALIYIYRKASAQIKPLMKK